LKRSTVVALAVLAAFAGYIYWYEREPVSDAEGEKIFEVEKESIERIELQRSPESEPVVLEKGEKGWRLTSPIAADADEAELDLLLQNLETMEFERAVAKASAVKLADFGLDPAKIEVRFRTKGGGTRSLAFGSDTPTPSNQYARRDGGEDVLVVASHLSMNFDKSAWDLRDKAVFALEGAPGAKRIEIEQGEGKLTLARQGELWFVLEPRSRADRNRVSGIASRVRTAEAKEIVAETSGELATYGLEEPSRRIRVELEGEGSPSIELLIGSQKGSDYYARNPARPEVFVIASDLVEEVAAPLAEIQSKKLFDYSTFEAKRVRLEAKGEAARELEKGDGEDKKWRETAPSPGRDLDTTAVEDLLYALNGATGSLSSAPAKSEPDFTVTVWSGDAPTEEKILVRKLAEGVEVERAGEAVALALTDDAWKEIEAKMNLVPREKKGDP
jgi:hypothetical protein